MIQFFEKIGDIISIAINFIISSINNLFYLLLMVPKSYMAIVEVLGLMPPFITVPIIAVLAYAMIIAIISKWS